MIELNRHIEILLLSNDCVIVPELGGFVAHHVNARYEDADGLFLPPLRTLGFNPQLKLNDHLLVQSYIEAYDISYPEALRRIRNEVEELKQHIENEGEYDLTDLGVLKLNEEGHYEFLPCEAGILSPMLYGLGSCSMLPIAQLQQKVKSAKPTKEVVATTIPEPVEETKAKEIPSEEEATDSDAIVIRMSWIRNAVAVAAAILLFFFISTPIDNSKLGSEIQQSSMLPVLPLEVQEKQPMSYVPQKAVQNQEAEVAESTAEEVPTAEPRKSYTIVLASQTPLRHAEEFIGRLTKNGIDGARVKSMSNTTKVRVVIGSYTTEEEAQTSLRSYRASSNVFKEAWVLSIEE